MAGLDAAGHVLDTLGKETHEATAEGVTGTVGVDDIGLGDLGDREDRDGITDGGDGLVSTLSDHDGAGTAVALGELSQLLGDLLDILGVPACSLAVGAGLVLVTKQEVGILDNSIETLLEELRQEGSAEVEGKDLVVGSSVLGDLDGGGETTIVGDEETTKVIVLGVLDDLPVLGLLQEIELELLGSSEIGHQGAIKARTPYKYPISQKYPILLSKHTGCGQ